MGDYKKDTISMEKYEMVREHNECVRLLRESMSWLAVLVTYLPDRECRSEVRALYRKIGFPPMWE